MRGGQVHQLHFVLHQDGMLKLLKKRFNFALESREVIRVARNGAWFAPAIIIATRWAATPRVAGHPKPRFPVGFAARGK